MIRQHFRVPQSWVASAVILFLVPVAAGGEPLDSSFSALIASGEFSLARQRINEAPAADRNRLRLELVRAQIGAGAVGGAARTLGEYSGDFSSSADSADGGFASQGRGGAVLADFDTLMELIRETINPDSWEETGGEGFGRMSPFPLGVLVDPRGRLSLTRPIRSRIVTLEQLRESARADRGNRDVRRRSPLRKVSLTRLERQYAVRALQGLPPTDEMLHVAGLHRITHLFFYPETGDVVIAGPADAWHADATGRHVSRSTGEPTLWLDDWIEVWRNVDATEQGFYCSIEPRAANLRRTAEMLRQSRTEGITGTRQQWVARLQQTLGEQDLVVRGIDPRSRAAQVILEADYHMKRIGVGLEDSVFGVPSYVSLLASSEQSASGGVLRWWFTLADTPVMVDPSGHAFELPAQPVRLQSENPMIDPSGKPTSVGKQDPLNLRFATGFTRNYDRLAQRYGIYADLRNIMHWALLAAVIQQEYEAGKIEWKGSFFRNTERCHVRLGEQPRTVLSVVNQQRLAGGRVITAVSGGVQVDPAGWLKARSYQQDRYGKLATVHDESERAKDLPPERWWWD